jgi:aryl-alcohol dehydrogenase-like predicted oxidoreductase
MNMEYTKFHSYNISKLTLGTVALGIDYGVFQHQLKPNSQESFKILSYAVKCGINTLDTARTYGDAESLIGEYFSANEKKNLNIITKFKLSQAGIINKALARKEAIESLKNSLSQLKLNSVPICLFHMDPELKINQVLETLPELFVELKNEGLIDHAGISVYWPDDVESCLEHSIIEAIQAPINIFDQRLLNANLLTKIKAKNKLFFARSVFMKGLLLMPPDSLKGNLVKATPFIKTLHELAKSSKISVAQLIFSYVRDLNGVTSIVFGAEKTEQIEQNIQLYQGPSLTKELRELIDISFKNIPEEIITPKYWIP